MNNNNILFKDHYLKQAEKLIWYIKPKVVFKKGKNNHYSWFPDGKINLYENCITRNLNKINKVAIRIYRYKEKNKTF